MSGRRRRRRRSSRTTSRSCAASLGDDRLQTQARGYALRVEPGELDVDRFRQRFEEGRGHRLPATRSARRCCCGDALALWRGPPLADFAYEAFAREEIGRLEELRLSALIERIDADLALGRHARPDRRAGDARRRASDCRSACVGS